jgi:hypothetical protein
VQDGHVIRHRRGLVSIVRHEQCRRAGLGEELAQVGEQLAPGRGVQAGEGLVEQEEPRSDGERPREADPLRLATGQSVRRTVGETRDAEALEPERGA